MDLVLVNMANVCPPLLILRLGQCDMGQYRARGCRIPVFFKVPDGFPSHTNIWTEAFRGCVCESKVCAHQCVLHKAVGSSLNPVL